MSSYDYLVCTSDVSPFDGETEPLDPEYTIDGKPLIYLADDSYVVRERLSPASGYSPVIYAPDRQYPENPTQDFSKGYRLVCIFLPPQPHYIVVSLQKSPDGVHWEDVNIGDPVIEGEWVDAVPTYNPSGGEIEWEHSPSDPGLDRVASV